MGDDGEGMLAGQVGVDEQGIEAVGSGLHPRNHGFAFDVTLGRGALAYQENRGESHEEGSEPLPALISDLEEWAHRDSVSDTHSGLDELRLGGGEYLGEVVEGIEAAEMGLDFSQLRGISPGDGLLQEVARGVAADAFFLDFGEEDVTARGGGIALQAAEGDAEGLVVFFSLEEKLSVKREQGRIFAGEFQGCFAVSQGHIVLVDRTIEEGEMTVQCALGIGREGTLEHGFAEVHHLRMAAEFVEDAEEPGLYMDTVVALDKGFGDDFL